MKNNVITNSKKSKKFLWILGIIAVIGLLFLVLIYFSGSLHTNYILYKIVDDFDDIVETLFELALTVAVIVFLIVFFKKIWNKL